ncbi:MAG TPA: acyltransferase [Candidatus Cybelea sp.]|nr:acyltransferase [Candidatus Cybelea sp.]
MQFENKKHFSGIELLRFLCAFAVLISHYPVFFYVAPGRLADSFEKQRQPFYEVFKLFYDHGNFAVYVFWAISGFIFFWKYADAVHTRRVSGPAFLVFRLSRLYPLHFATLILAAALQAAFLMNFHMFYVYPWNDAYHFVLNLFFISEWGFRKGFSFNAPIWSVSTEVFAYGLFFVLARLANLNLRATLAVLAVSMLLYGFLPRPQSLLLCVVMFYVGGIMYHAVEAWGRIKHKHGRGADAVLLCGALSVFVAGFAAWQQSEDLLGTPLANTMRYYLLVPCLIFFFAGISLPARLSPVSYLGNLTYSSYLLHFPMQIALVLTTELLGIDRSLYYRDGAFLLFVAAVFVLAHYVYRYYEMPAQDAIRLRAQIWAPAQMGSPKSSNTF